MHLNNYYQNTRPNKSSFFYQLSKLTTKTKLLCSQVKEKNNDVNFLRNFLKNNNLGLQDTISSQICKISSKKFNSAIEAQLLIDLNNLLMPEAISRYKSDNVEIHNAAFIEEDSENVNE